MRSGTDCGNKRQRVDCSVVLEMAQKEPSPDRGVKYRSPLGLSVLVSVQWFGSSKGNFGCRRVWFKCTGISSRKFPILSLLSAEHDFHSVPDTASLALLIFHVEPGINIVSTPFSEKSANCICVSLEDTGSSSAFSFGETWSDGVLRRAATRNLPGEGRFTVSQISVTALSFSNSAANIRRAITVHAQKRLLLNRLYCLLLLY